jgi:NAD(P)-dependent dehydrogenase (short-subunit alcohol dehydrogenase family)
MANLREKKVIVTGATSGIGQAIALRCAADGADVAYCGLTADGAAETTAAIERAGQRAFFKVVDLTDLDSARRFGQEAIDALGGVDALVNNAGANTWHSVENCTWEQMDNCLRVNFYHAWILSQVCIPSMRAAGGGVIVNMSSINAVGTLPGVFPYNMAKTMLVSLTRSISIEHGRDNIRSVAIQPGTTLTALAEAYFDSFPDPQEVRRRFASHYPLNRFAKPEEIAATVAHIVSGENSFMSGNAIMIDGGITNMFETPNGW